MVLVNLVVKASKGVVVEGYAFKDAGDAEDKADNMRNSREFNENDEDVCVIYDTEVKERKKVELKKVLLIDARSWP